MATEKRLIAAHALASDFMEYAGLEFSGRDAAEWVNNAPTVDAIPIAVMKRAIKGIDAADQCDQAGRYDYELRAALKTVLKWYESPLYKEYEANTNLEG